MPSLRDPFQGNFFLLVADTVHILEAAGEFVGLIAGTDEGDHFSGFPFEGGLHSGASGEGCFSGVGERLGEDGAALAEVQLDGADLDSEAFPHEVFQIFSATREHLVAESVGAGGTGVFADKFALRVMDALRRHRR